VTRIPPIFVGHGTPALALDPAVGNELRQWMANLPRPRAILVISAHWQTRSLTRGSTAARPKLLYDVDGYDLSPDDLARVRYPAPGAPELADELARIVALDRSERGWDHGVWAPLVHLFPEADIPVLQLSLVMGATPRRLFGLGQQLGVLATRGCLLVGSGGITHNLAEASRERDAAPASFAREFDGWVTNVLADAATDELLTWRTGAPAARRAHPTSEHLDPLFVIAGAASLTEHAVGFPVRGFVHRTLSRRCVQFGR
jgi:4,5-DOPA dioxygenase extradiol